MSMVLLVWMNAWAFYFPGKAVRKQTGERHEVARRNEEEDV